MKTQPTAIKTAALLKFSFNNFMYSFCIARKSPCMAMKMYVALIMACGLPLLAKGCKLVTAPQVEF